MSISSSEKEDSICDNCMLEPYTIKILCIDMKKETKIDLFHLLCNNCHTQINKQNYKGCSLCKYFMKKANEPNVYQK